MLCFLTSSKKEQDPTSWNSEAYQGYGGPSVKGRVRDTDQA